MKKLIFLFSFFSAILEFTYAQTGSNCLQANPFCTGSNYTFPNNTGVPSLGSVGCLGSTPNPVWYYMQVETAGNIDITIQQTSNGGSGIDVDFAVWGPFTSLAAGCGSPFPAGTPVDCSYSTAFIETANIPNAQPGQFYVLLITNFNGSAGTITFSQTGGAGSTDCGILSNADNDGPVCLGEPVTLTANIANASSYTLTWYLASDLTTPIGSGSPYVITPPAPGTYDVALIALDNISFEADTAYTTVVVNPIPSAPSFTSTAPACQGSTVTMTPDNIISGATYSWSGTNGFTSNQSVVSFPNATPGIFNADYTLVVTVNGCVSPPYTQSLSIYPTIVPVVTGPNEVCEGAFVSLEVTNANAFQSFAWNSIPGTNPQPVPAGSYIVSATDTNGCVTQSSPAHVVNLIANPLDISGDSTFCEGNNVVLNATPGKQSYTWSNGSSSETATYDQDGWASVTVLSQEGCLRSDSIYVVMYDKPVAAFSPEKVCAATSVTFTDGSSVSDVYGSTLVSWAWNFNHLNPDSTQALSTAQNPTHAFPGPGTYLVNLQVASSEGCKDTLVLPFLVVDPPHVNFSFESLCFGQGVFSNTTVQGSFPFESAVWSFGDASANESTLDTAVYHLYSSISTYTVNLTVTDTAGCVSDTTIDITLKNTPLFNDIPNVITPNGDNINDDFGFIPEVGDCYNYTFAVFNRWGSKVFETEAAGSKPFNGISNLGSKLHDGTYYWVLIAYGQGAGAGEKILKKGSITIAGTK